RGAAAPENARGGAPSGPAGYSNNSAPAGGGFGGRGGRGGGAALEWQPNIGGCESGFTIPMPDNSDVVYASCYGNKVTRWDARTGTARSIEPWMGSLDSPPDEAEDRCHWTAPMAIGTFGSNNFLHASQLLLQTSTSIP